MSGISETVVYARTPATGSPLRFTGYATPSKSASRTLRKSSPPMEPRLDDAPTTATVRGEKKGCSDATTATWSRSSTRSRYSPVGTIDSRTSTSP